MKIYIIIVYMILGGLVFSQNTSFFRMYLIKDINDETSEIKNDADEVQDKFSSASVAKTQESSDKIRKLSPRSFIDNYLPVGTSYEFIQIRAYSDVDCTKEIPLMTTKAAKAVFLANGEKFEFYFTYETQAKHASIQISESMHKDLPSLRAGDIVEVNLVDSINNLLSSRYFMYWQSFEWYDLVNMNLIGFHVPANLYSLSFPPEGVIASIMPISVAWGFKINCSSIDFIGLNLFGSIAFHGSSTPNTYIITSGVGGVYIDVSDYFYLGGSFGKSFVSTTPDLGGMLVFGLGKKLLAFLAN